MGSHTLLFKFDKIFMEIKLLKFHHGESLEKNNFSVVHTQWLYNRDLSECTQYKT